MLKLLNYENKVFSYICDTCNGNHDQDMTGIELSYNDELGEYYPVGLQCVHCAELGRDDVTFINMNLPVIDDMEVAVMEDMADDDERCTRRQIRKFMWDFVPELREKNRQQFEAEFAENNADKLAEIRASIELNENS